MAAAVSYADRGASAIVAGSLLQVRAYLRPPLVCTIELLGKLNLTSWLTEET